MVNFAEFERNIASGGPACVYLIFGSSEYMRGRALSLIREKLASDGEGDLNRESFAENASPSDIAAACSTFSFFGGRKLVEVKNYSALKASRRAGEGAQEGAKASLFELEEYIASPSDGTVLLFVSADADKRSRIYRHIDKYGVAVECEDLKDIDLLRWIQQEAARRGLKLGRRACEKLQELCADMQSISMEIDKLAAYAASEGRADADTVERLVAPNTEFTVYKLTDAIIAGDMQTACERLHNLYENGTSPYYILSALGGQFRRLYSVKTLQAQGMNPGAIAGALKIPDWQVRTALRQCAGKTQEEIKNALRLLTDTEYGIKTGRYYSGGDNAVMEYLIGCLAGRKTR